MLEEEVTVTCPYCGEPFSTLVDCSAGAQHYVEECQICCQPIVFRSDIDAEGHLHRLDLCQENA